jgi:hypothetical protein
MREPTQDKITPRRRRAFRTVQAGLVFWIGLTLLADFVGPQSMAADSPRPKSARSASGVEKSTPVRARSGPLAGSRARPRSTSGRLIRIDEQFVRRKPPGPLVLNQPETTYVLERDVRTSGTAVVVAAPGVTLDLNGHEMLFADCPPPVVANGGFEEGGGRSVPGWDLKDAPHTAIAQNTNYLTGKQVLRLSDVRGRSQRIVSQPITIERGNRSYAAAITPGGHAPDGTKLVVTVIDAASGRPIATGESRNVERGFSAVAHFSVASSTRVRLQVDVTPPPNRAANSDEKRDESEVLDLDDALILPSYVHGILATRTWSGELNGWSNLPEPAMATYRTAASFTVRNGKIRKGANDGYGCIPLYCNNVPGLVIENVETFTRGVDTQSLSADHASGTVAIRNSTFTEETWLITDRMASYSSLLLTNIKGPLTVETNTLIHSPQIGINLGWNDPRWPVKVSGNVLKQRAVTTNGYGIVVASLQGFEISDNRLVAENGRGIDVDGFAAEPVRDGVIRNNHVDVRERQNREYPTGGEARALRLRNNVDAMGPHRNLQILDNVFIARTGPGLCPKAFGARISYLNNGHAMDDAGIVIRGNTFTARVGTDNPEFHAEAFVIDTLAPGIRPTIEGNVFESNDISLAIGDSEAGDNNDVTLVSNTLKRAGEPVRDYTGVKFGYWTERIAGVQLIDNRVKGTRTAPFAWSGSGSKEVSVGRLVQLVAKTNWGEPASKATVTVTDERGRSSFSGLTDRDGKLAIPVPSETYRQPGEDPKSIETVRAVNQRVTATLGAASASATLGSSDTVSLTLK